MPWLIMLLVVVVVTLVGHGIWVLVATICRALFFDLAPPPIRCRHCGRAGVLRDGRCQQCGELQKVIEQDEQTDLAAVTRQLRRWQSRGTIKPRIVERWLTRIDAYRQSLSQPAKMPNRVAQVEPVLAEVIEPIVRPRQQLGTAAAERERRIGVSPPTPQASIERGLPVPPSLAGATLLRRLQQASSPPTPPAPQPRRSLSETLAAFMEERNIRWGELAGGSLIVCSSVALVISLWEQLDTIPYFQFVIFVAVTAALFGIGLYTEHRWKLTSTSRGLLIIAALLVPLNFVAMVATRKPGFDAIAFVTELVALGVFVALVGKAGRVLLDRWAQWLTLAVVGNSAALLLLMHDASPAWSLLVGATASVINAVAIGAVLHFAGREQDWSDNIVARLFTLIGIASFALLVTLSMAALRSGDRWLALHTLAPLLVTAALPALTCGLLVMTVLSTSAQRGGWRTAATIVALVSATVMPAALALAWPLPGSMMAVGILNFAALFAFAWRYRLPMLHGFAAACLAVAYVVASQIGMGRLAFAKADALAVARQFIDASTGVWLIGLFLLFAALADVLRRRSRPSDAIFYAAACAASAAVSLSLVSWPVFVSGGDRALRAALVWAAYGIAGFLVNARQKWFTREVEAISAALLYVAALFGTTSWLVEQAWVDHQPGQLLSRLSLQCYAAAWAALSLAFVLLRIAVRRRQPSWLFAADALRVDRIALRLIAAASLALAVWQVLPGVVAEFSGASLPTAPWAFDTLPGWCLAALTALGLLAALWDKWRDDDLVASVLLSLNAAALAAVPWSAAMSAASALRWALAVAFAGSAAIVWLRSSLANACQRVGCRLQLSSQSMATARTLWVIAAALPVVVISAATAAMRIAGQPPAGPLSGSWFATLGMELSHLLPLAVIVLGLVVYAVRETSPGYAFGAGLVANLTATGGYALTLRTFGAWQAVCLVQIATLTAAVWAIGWLAARRWVLARGGLTVANSARPLLRVQLAQNGLGNLLLVFSAAALLFVASPVLPSSLGAWVGAVGSPLGWLTLVIASAAGMYRLRHFGERLRPELIGLVGLAVLVLAAATIEWRLPGTPWSYRALLLGWAMYALSVVAATWWATMLYTPAGTGAPPPALVRATALWVRLAGLLTVALGLKTVMLAGIDDVETLWAAGAIGIASTACAAMAVWLRREGWAFAAGMGVNLAASLAVCHRLALDHRPLGDESLLLWQANVIAGAVVALIWLAARQGMYAGRGLSLAASPLLTTQVASVAAAAVGLVVMPCVSMLAWPGGDSLPLAPFAESAGWFAWMLAGLAAALYLYHATRRTVDVVAVFLLGSGVLAAAQSSSDAIASYTTLTTAWLAAGSLLLAATWLFERWKTAGRPLPADLASCLHSALDKRAAEPWIAGIPLLVAGAALRGSLFERQWGEVLGIRVLAAALLPSVLAVWLRQSRHAYSGGLLVHLAASMFWYAQPEPAWIDLLLANATAAAGTAIVWSLRTSLFGPLETGDGDQATPPLEHASLAVASSLLAMAGGWSWLAAALGTPLDGDVRLTWLGVSAAAVAGLMALWDKRTAIACPALYATGIAAMACTLAGRGIQGDDLLWITGPAIGAWLLAAAIVRSVALSLSIRGRFRLPVTSSAQEWFPPTQGVFSALATALAVWTCLHFTTPGERLLGPATAALVLAATFFMTRGASAFWSIAWKVGSLALVALLPAELGWSWLSGNDAAILWIHRQAILLASVMLVVAACELFATRWLPVRSSWSTALNCYLSIAIATTLVVLVAVLLQEMAAMPDLAADGTRSGIAMALAAKLAVVAALVELFGLVLRYAVKGDRDPLRLSPSGRQAYVYAAELLGLAICLHFRITMPKLIPFGILENWWTLVVMVVAFAGVGLSELFKRRNLDVLSIPLRRTALAAPLLPVLALAVALVWQPSGSEDLHLRARLVSDEAVFFLVALFYALESWLRRSLGLAVLSAVAGNTGLWLLWHRFHFDFLLHPQLWLIPPALAALVAEYLNHARLTRQQSDATRYLALSMIYASSTADVFISHVGRQISLPLVFVLMGLSVLGMLSGMLLRVRSFLYLGFTFLLIDLSIIVYHAAWDLGHTWVFWAANLAVGIAILALFAFFEKRRNEAARQVASGD